MQTIFTALLVAVCWLGTTAMALGESLLPAQIHSSRFITYTPRSFSTVDGTVTPATKEGIQEDLKLLRPFFDGLITYSSENGLELIPALAHDQGFRAIILGMWDPLSETEAKNIIAAAKKYPDIIVAVVVGNEGIFTKRYKTGDVVRTMQRIKHECPTLLVTTSEPFFLYFKKEYIDFFKAHDLLMPNVHPVFEQWFKPNEPIHGVEMVINVATQFRTTYPLPILIKETGIPSGPQGQSGYSQKGQALFWSEILKRFPSSPNLALACFEAFDAHWKPAVMATEYPGNHAIEAFWGFFTAQGKGKEVVATLSRLAVKP